MGTGPDLLRLLGILGVALRRTSVSLESAWRRGVESTIRPHADGEEVASDVNAPPQLAT